MFVSIRLVAGTELPARNRTRHSTCRIVAAPSVASGHHHLTRRFDVSDINDMRVFLTVPEAAQRLRISRTAAYQLVRAWLDDGGTSGIPAVRIGRSIRVPSAALERLAQGVSFEAAPGA